MKVFRSKQEIQIKIACILNSENNTDDRLKCISSLIDFAYYQSIDGDDMLYIIDSLYILLLDINKFTSYEEELFITSILDLYSIFSLEQSYYVRNIYDKIISIYDDSLPVIYKDFINEIINEWNKFYDSYEIDPPKRNNS